MTRILILFLFFFLKPTITAPFLQFNFVVWNVGQGLWISVVENEACYHVDMGGEFYPSDVEKLCGKKHNSIYLTHLDWDHRSFILKFTKSARNTCLFFPRPLPSSIAHLPLCPHPPDWIKVISFGNPKFSKNAGSLVYFIKKTVLISGDSPISEEKKWVPRIKKSISILILGHHGSKTSTSIQLLNKLRPEMAIASARKKRYGHPHKKVSSKLKKHKISLLKTENLGHIYMTLSETD